MDTYYFEMKKEWAENRLDEWSKRQEQPVENFLILFDVAQDFSLEKTKPETYNSFKGFILIDLTDSIEFVFFNKNKIIIKSLFIFSKKEITLLLYSNYNHHKSENQFIFYF